MRLLSFFAIGKAHDGDTFHKTADGITEEFTPWFEGAVYANVMLGRHEKVAGLWRMVRCLLRDVVATCGIWIVPPPSKDFAENWVERFLDTTVRGQQWPSSGN